MSVGIILQARMGSTRLPGKMLMEIAGITLLDRCLSIMKRVNNVETRMFLATTNLPEDKILLSKSKSSDVQGYGGHPSDLIERFMTIAMRENLKVICRLTGDNPFIDYNFIEYSIDKLRNRNFETPTIVTSRGSGLASGLDVETFNIEALKKACHQSEDYDREHITSGMSADKGFNVIKISGEQIHKGYSRLTIDFARDLEIASSFAVKFDTDYRSIKDFNVRGK